MTKKVYLLSLLFLISLTCYGQLSEITTLKNRLPYLTDSIKYTDALNRIAMLSYEQNIDSTFHYTLKARAIANRLNYTKGNADALNNLGVVYDMKGNLQLAFRYYNEAYNTYKTLHDTSNIVQTIMNIASVYKETGKHDKAISGFKKALAAGSKLQHNSIMSLVYYNYVLMFADIINKHDMPIYIHKAQQIASKYNDKRVLLAIDHLKSNLYIQNGERDTGLKMLEKTIENVLSYKLYYLSLDMLIDLGNQYQATDTAKAIKSYKRALAITERKGYTIYTTHITKILYDFYVNHQEKSTAFYYSQKLLHLYNQQEIIDSESGVDYIEYALKDQALKAAYKQSKYQLIFLFLAILVCVMTIVIIIILWRNWKTSKKTNEALRIQFQQLESTTEALELMNKDYARVIKVVAHDLRNPIGAIRSIALMINTDEASSSEIKELITLIQASSNNCLELINELLETDITQQQILKQEQVYLGDLLSQSVRLLNFKAKDKGQRVILNGQIKKPITADYERLWRVINNLIINAIKFSPEGADIVVEAKEENNEIFIDVIDNGIGIPISLQSKIFDPFTSARRKGTDGEQPFGLGLYISKQIIEMHHGKIWFESTPGKQTIFHVQLPSNL